MKKEKLEKKEAAAVENKVEYFTKYKNARMIRISGSFMGGGFNISQNKAKAILENIETVKEFVSGKFDAEIDELGEDEILKY